MLSTVTGVYSTTYVQAMMSYIILNLWLVAFQHIVISKFLHTDEVQRFLLMISQFDVGDLKQLKISPSKNDPELGLYF